MYQYKAKCLRVIDGDTLELQVDMGFHIFHVIRGRLFSVDAPEIFSGNDKQNGMLAKQHLESLVLNKELVINTYKDKTSFGRWIVEIKNSSNESINELMQNYCSNLYKKSKLDDVTIFAPITQLDRVSRFERES